MGKMTYKKVFAVVTLCSLLVGLAACGNSSTPKVKKKPVPAKVIHKSTTPKPEKKKITEAFKDGEEGTLEALGETKRVIWDAYPDQLAYVKDAFYHWTLQDDWFQVTPGHYMVVDRLNSSGALLKKLAKGTPVKLNGENYHVADYRDFEGNGSADSLLNQFKAYVNQFPKTAYFIQTCLDARTYGGQRLVVLDVAQ